MSCCDHLAWEPVHPCHFGGVAALEDVACSDQEQQVGLVLAPVGVERYFELHFEVVVELR